MLNPTPPVWYIITLDDLRRLLFEILFEIQIGVQFLFFHVDVDVCARGGRLSAKFRSLQCGEKAPLNCSCLIYCSSSRGYLEVEK